MSAVGTGGRSGAALPLVLLLLLALTALGQATLVLATAELQRASAATELGLSGTSSRAALGRLEELFRADTAPADAAGEVSERGTVGRRTRRERVDREHWLLGAEGTAPSAAAVRVGANVPSRWAWGWTWALEPARRLQLVPAAAVAGGAVTGAGSVDGRGAWLLDTEDRLRCAAGAPRLDSLAPFGGDWADVRGGLGTTSAARLGRLPADSLAARLEVIAAGALRPAPVDFGGRCVDGPDNWGDPTGVAAPCADRWRAGASMGHVELMGGEGQGLLVVIGDLVVRDARWDGALIATGSVILEGATSVRGFVRAGGDVRLGPSSRLQGAVCPAWRALRAEPRLRWPTTVPEPLLPLRPRR